MHEQEIPVIGRNVFELFWMPLYTDYWYDPYKKFQIATSYYTNEEH